MYPPYDDYQKRAGSRQIPVVILEADWLGMTARLLDWVRNRSRLFSRPYSNEIIGRHSMRGDEDLFAPAAGLVKFRLNHFQLGT